jgi:RNA polymerase sigma-70 factor (ECF subfamily)
MIPLRSLLLRTGETSLFSTAGPIGPSDLKAQGAMSDSPADVTLLLRAVQKGDDSAREQLVGAVYEELKQIAVGLMRNERGDHSLHPTALVNEAFIRLLGSGWLGEAENRRHLYSAAATAMRRVLVDHARTRNAAKRGGGRERILLDEAIEHLEKQQMEVVAVHEALEELAVLNSRQSQVIELRFFGGFNTSEIADILAVSSTTIESDFRKARAFLGSRLHESG